MTKTHQFHQNDAICGNVLYIFRILNVSSYMYRCMHKYKHLFGNVLWLLRRSSVHELYLFGVVERNCFSNRPVWNVFLLSSCCLDFSTLDPKKNPPGRGIEFATSSGRCEIWLRSGGILASNSVSGHECWRYVDPNGGSHLPNETTTLMPHQLSLAFAVRKKVREVFFCCFCWDVFFVRALQKREIRLY